MLLRPSKPDAVYRLRAGSGVDSYGDPVESWDSPERVLLKGATVQDVSTVEEDGVTKHILRGEKTLFVPGAADLTEADRVEIAGEVWKVSGSPSVKRGLGSAVYTVSALSRITTS